MCPKSVDVKVLPKWETQYTLFECAFIWYVVSVTLCAFVINCSYLFANDSYLFASHLYCEQLIANAHKVTDTTLIAFLRGVSDFRAIRA